MIESIVFVNHKGERLPMPLDGFGSEGLILLGMDGIGPGEGDIVMTDVVAGDGGVFNLARLKERNITVELKVMPARTMAETRRTLYKFFGVKKKITVEITTDVRRLAIDGYVESNDINVFSKWEKAKISILCPDPYFYDPLNLITKFDNENPLFEFPFNEELTRGEYHIELDKKSEPIKLPVGEIVVHDWEVLDYYGDGDTGVIVSIYVSGDVTNPRVINRNTREMIEINTDKLADLMVSLSGAAKVNHLIAGDKIIIDTNIANKSVKLLRGGITYNILNCIDRRADWFRITSGENVFVVDADSGMANLMLYLETKVLYEGV